MFTDESLLAPDFDAASYLRHALQVSSTSFESEQLRLSRCLEKIETEIHATVQTNRDALIGSVQEVGAAQRTTNAVLSAVDQLSSSVRRMRHTVHEPYLQMEQRVHELRNVHSCLSLVRSVQRYMNVASKLKGAADGDLVRAARLLREAEELQASCDFSGIPFVDAIAPAVAQASNAIRTKLSEALRSAIANASPSELAVSLQCAASMGALQKTVAGILTEIKREASRTLVKELDNASAFGSEMDAAFREAIFSALEKALSQVSVQLRTFGLLWTALRKRRDPATDVAYWWQLTNADRRSFDSIWTSVLNQIKERLLRLSKRGSVLVAVSTEYGRLNLQLRSFLNAVRETLGHVYYDGDDVDDSLVNSTIDDVVTKLSCDFEPRFKLSLQDRLRERMSSVLNKISTIRPSPGAEATAIDIKADIRLLQATTAAAAGARNAPAMVVHPVAGSVDPKAFFKCVANEVASSRSDDTVLAVVIKAVCDEIETFSKRCSDTLRNLPVPELPKVSAGSTTALQLFHIQLANAASAFVLEMQSLAAMLPSTYKSAGLEKSLVLFNQQIESLTKFVSQIVQPYFSAASVVLLQCVDNFISDYYERGVSRPHQNALATSVKGRITDFAVRYGLLFDARAGTVAARACFQLADKILQRFVVRMLLRRGGGSQGDNVRKLVTEDCNNIQDAVQVLHPLDRLARRLSQVRAIRSLSQASSSSSSSSSADFDAVLQEHVNAKFHPVVILLSVVQRIPAAAAPTLASQLKVTPQQLTAMLESLLSASPRSNSDDTLSSSSSSSATTTTTLMAKQQQQHNNSQVGGSSSWEESKWLVVWDACNALVGDVERGLQQQTGGGEPLCDVEVAKRARRIVDALRQ